MSFVSTGDFMSIQSGDNKWSKLAGSFVFHSILKMKGTLFKRLVL